MIQISSVLSFMLERADGSFLRKHIDVLNDSDVDR